ncbi:MAG: hypothetical protein K9N48_05800 [Verrucomicrobia bacterium]|nr:hypothetical protein [Verrucomicrobiota bacterium]MCF7708897.1 hypothetical protein [Verrucomicrobiota bacterium]
MPKKPKSIFRSSRKDCKTKIDNSALLFIPCLAAALIIFSGCAGYNLGPTGGAVAGNKSIQIHPFQNNTSEPRITTPLVNAFRKQIQKDGTYTLSSTGDADVIVRGEITDFNREEMSFQPGDILTARDYRLSMTAHVTATDRATGKNILDQEIIGRSTIRISADLAIAEKQAVPLMAEDLARKATSLLVDGTW